MDIQYKKNIKLISVIDNIKTYELTIEFIYQYTKLCIYYCTFSLSNNAFILQNINTSLRMVAPEYWAVSYATIIDGYNNIIHHFNFYKQPLKIMNKKFYQSISIKTGRNAINEI